MRGKFPGKFFQWVLIFLLGGLSGCGEAEPFVMGTNGTMFVGDPTPTTPMAFLINPEEQQAEGDLTAEIETVFPDRIDLSLQSLTMTFIFSSIGPINLTLDPNNPSSATIFKLNSSDNPSGTNTMTLNLIIETPDENLSLPDVQLAGDTLVLELAEDLPTLGFIFQGQAKELDLSALNVVVPAELIDSDNDPQ